MTTYSIGTSGYSYKQWKGVFYPEDLANEDMLRYYAERLDTVEINSTFYRFATVRQLESWSAEVGDDFTFTLKAPRRITHNLRLRDAAELAGDFCRNAASLGDKLGVVLFQLPPNLKKDTQRLETFLDALAPQVRIVFELRHASWFDSEVFECLRKRGVALCINDDGKVEGPSESTAPFGYFRMRRDAYDAAALEESAARIRAASAGWNQAFVYFKHEDQGPAYALRLRELLD